MADDPDLQAAIDTSEPQTAADAVNSAADTIYNALQYGRKLHGLPTDEAQGALPAKQTYRDDIIPAERGGGTPFSPHGPMDWLRSAGSNPDVSQGHPETTADVMNKRDAGALETGPVSRGQRSLDDSGLPSYVKGGPVTPLKRKR